MSTFLIFVVVFPILLITYFYLQEKRNRAAFESKGIPYLGNGTIRLIKNTLNGVRLHDDLLNQYRITKASKTKLVGATDFGEPTLVINDPELIKLILVKDFDHFVDRRKFAVLETSEIFAKMIFGMRGDRWKALRTK